MPFMLKIKDQRIVTYESGKLFNLVNSYVKYYNILDKGQKLEFIVLFPNEGLIIINFGSNSVTKNELILYKLKIISEKIK